MKKLINFAGYSTDKTIKLTIINYSQFDEHISTLLDGIS